LGSKKACISWPLQKQIWSFGKPKGRGLLGNKKRGHSLRGRGNTKKKKKERLYSHAILHFERETVEKRK